MSGFSIGNRHVGDGAPCLIVGEVAQAHEGSLSLAHAYIDAIADAGADAVKFQCHIAEAESTPDEPWRVKPDYPQDASRYAYWRRMQFTAEQWEGLRQHAQQAGLFFIVSPFSVEAVDMLERFAPVDAWKVASGEVAHVDLLKAIRATGKPVLISTGMSSDSDAWLTVGVFDTRRLAVLQCTSMYPTPANRVGLSVLEGWRKEVDCPVGLSDHSGTIYAGLAAVALGCDVLEVHVTFSREMQGFDTSSSITTQELRQLVEGIRFIEKAKQPVDKDALARELEPMRELFMRKHERKAAAAIPAPREWKW